MISAAITAGLSAIAALLAAIVTAMLTRKREHEGDWRKLKLAQYQEFVLALSGVVKERATIETQRRYSDAVNAMMLIASMPVIRALDSFQREISFSNKNSSEEQHDRCLSVLFRAMRDDIQPRKPDDDPKFRFRLLGIPPDLLEKSSNG